MSDGDALLAAILAHPEEDAPRLLFADWLDENGQPERAMRVRVADPWPLAQFWRTNLGRGWWQYARSLAPCLPRSWSVWPIQYPPGAEWTARTLRDENCASWEFSQGITSFRSADPYFIVGLRYGFLSAVAAPVRRLVKVLPALVRIQPVHHVAVTDWFPEFECYLRQVGLDGSRATRTIRLGANRIPPRVFERLTPPPVPCYGPDTMRVYPNQTAAFEDLGRAFLAWARDTTPRSR